MLNIVVKSAEEIKKAVKKKINIVWIKRDIRTQDHEPLYYAETLNEDYLIIYIFDSELLCYGDLSLRHHQFVYSSISDVNEKLKKYKRSINIFYDLSKNIFRYLAELYDIKNVLSYKEAGIRASWNRDNSVQRVFNSKNINWIQFDKQGVKRGIKSRDGWDKNWYYYVNQEIKQTNFSVSDLSNKFEKFLLPTNFRNQIANYSNSFLKAGENEAHKVLESFAFERNLNYSKYISKPLKSHKSCSRLSPYLAWGNISVRQAYQQIKRTDSNIINKRSVNAFTARLKWRSHFIQKFESDCDYENKFINRAYENIKFDENTSFLQKWKEGLTGYPLVDATMRCLIETGWINFRMRAMLVSFLCHHLNQDWRNGIYHMSNMFLDYEPGIHYTQFQMQAGLTGFNTIRIYNPIKQSIEHDSLGEFIKKWVPELRDMNSSEIHEPWLHNKCYSLFDNIDNSSKYNDPIVPPVKSVVKSRQQLWSIKKNKFAKSESKRLMALHVRKRTTRLKRN